MRFPGEDLESLSVQKPSRGPKRCSIPKFRSLDSDLRTVAPSWKTLLLFLLYPDSLGARFTHCRQPRFATAHKAPATTPATAGLHKSGPPAALIASALLTGAQMFVSFDSQCRALAAAQRLKIFPALSAPEKQTLASLRSNERRE